MPGLHGQARRSNLCDSLIPWHYCGVARITLVAVHQGMIPLAPDISSVQAEPSGQTLTACPSALVARLPLPPSENDRTDTAETGDDDDANGEKDNRQIDSTHPVPPGQSGPAAIVSALGAQCGTLARCVWWQRETTDRKPCC